MREFVILDRDGVINQDSPDYIKSPDEWIPIEGSLEAIALLSEHEIDVYIATNQAGIARGILTEESLRAIHQKMLTAVTSLGGKITDIRYCPHHPDAACECRKPQPGMLYSLAEEHQLSLPGAPFVGDSLKDIRAAESAGCQSVLVLTGNGEETFKLRPRHAPVFDNLMAFARQMTGTVRSSLP